MLPYVFIRAADARPFEIQDLLPADTRFKVLVFTGDTTDADQLARVRKLAENIDSPKSFYKKFGGQQPAQVFDILSISSVGKEHVNYTDMPPVLRTHWSK
jgi:phenol 2-monooxygenase (NADPH)